MPTRLVYQNDDVEPRVLDAFASMPHTFDTQWHEKLRDGTTVLIRPIRAEDIEMERHFIEHLSAQTRRFRFLGSVTTPSEALLHQFTNPDPLAEAAFVAFVEDSSGTQEIGVSRWSSCSDGLSCECAVVVADQWQKRGLASLLMQHLIDLARERGIQMLYAMTAGDNWSMHELGDHLGFRRSTDPNDRTQVLLTLDLVAATA